MTVVMFPFLQTQRRLKVDILLMHPGTPVYSRIIPLYRLHLNLAFH